VETNGGFYNFLPLKYFFTTKPILQKKRSLVNQPSDQFTKIPSGILLPKGILIFYG